MKERSVEKRFCAAVKDAGCTQIKLGFDGWPDRQVLVGSRKHYWAELKSPTGKLGPNQIQRIKMLRKAGELVLVLDGSEDLTLVAERAMYFVRYGMMTEMSHILRGPATRLE